MSRRSLVESIDVRAPQQVTWDALVDWDSQGAWMLATRVRGTTQDGHGVGGGVEAFTGLGRLGVRDPMTVTVWQPPTRCTVAHTGRVVRGTGDFQVLELDAGASRVLWAEHLDLPLGRLGSAGWVLVRPIARLGVALSLRRFRRYVERRRP